MEPEQELAQDVDALTAALDDVRHPLTHELSSAGLARRDPCVAVEHVGGVEIVDGRVSRTAVHGDETTDPEASRDVRQLRSVFVIVPVVEDVLDLWVDVHPHMEDERHRFQWVVADLQDLAIDIDDAVRTVQRGDTPGPGRGVSEDALKRVAEVDLRAG